MIEQFTLTDGNIVPCSGTGPISIYTKPTEAEIAELVDRWKIKYHNVQCALDADEIGRLEFDSDTEQVAMIIRCPRNYSSQDHFLFRVMSMGVFLFRDRMIIVLADRTSIFEGKITFKIKTLYDVLIKLIYSTITHFTGHLKVINMISDELERKVNKSIENKFLLNMFTLEKSLVYFLNALNDNSTVINKLKTNAAKIGFSAENVEFLDDLMIDNSQCLTLAQTYSNILSSLMDARASVVNNNLNVMMKNLNAIVIAVAIPSFFAGVGGMSEFSAVTGIKSWAFSYSLFVLVMLLMGIGTFFLIKQLERFWR